MEIKNDIQFFKQLAQFRRDSDSHSPDAFNVVARELYGMSVKEAQMLYTKFRRIATGWWPWDEKHEEETIDILTKAKAVLEHSFRLDPADKWQSIESFMGSGSYSDRNRIGVWAKYDGKEPQLFEFWLNSPKSLAMIHDMNERCDVQIICIVPWVDCICNVNRDQCLNDLGEGRTDMHVYDGDLFVLLNKGVDNYWNKPSENGIYVCLWGAYRRLLYTVGRGYLNIDKEPNIASKEDEDDEYGDVFCYDEGRWNHHIMTMDHQWKRIGNIHADVTLLMEKKPKED